MTSPADLHTALVSRLRSALAGRVTVYDGDVPGLKPDGTPNDPPQADGQGRVFPYCVVWSSPGAAPAEAAVHDVSTGLDWAEQVTVAAGDPGWCLQAVPLVRAAAVGAVLVPDAGPLIDETPRSRGVLRDPDAGPPRWFVPLQFGCLTA